jgi:hypothetical protein
MASTTPALQERRIDIGALPPQELASLRAQLEADLDGLQARGGALSGVASQFAATGRAIERLGEATAGKRGAGGGDAASLGGVGRCEGEWNEGGGGAG